MMTKIREGYKETEVGVIPENWDVDTFENICIPKGLVRGPFGGAIKKEYFVEKGYKIYEQKNAINKDATIGEYFVGEDKFKELKRFEVKGKDFIVSCSGTIGRIFQIPEIYERGIINQALLKITVDHNKVNDSYFYNYFEWDSFQKKIIDNTQGGAMKNLVGMDIIKRTLFCLPPLPEQQRIAEILSTTDAHIEKLDQIIEDYQLLKKGMMKKLLTEGIGHTEFKETEIGRIPKEWEVVELREMFDFYGGYSVPRAQLTEKGAYYIHYGDIHTRTRTYISTEEDCSWLPRFQIEREKVGASLKTGDIVFADASEDYEGVGKSVVIVNNGYEIVAGLHTIVAKEKTETLFLGFKRYFLDSVESRSQFKRLATGSKVYGISKGNLGKIVIPVPTIEEQKIISELLSNIDYRIEMFETEKNDFIQLKKSLMEKLLTGKIRTTEIRSLEA